MTIWPGDLNSIAVCLTRAVSFDVLRIDISDLEGGVGRVREGLGESSVEQPKEGMSLPEICTHVKLVSTVIAARLGRWLGGGGV